MSLLAIKVFAAVAILVVGIVGGVVPLLAAGHRAIRRLLSLGNALSGGIFLGAGFVHLLPKAGDALEKVAEYPLAPLLAAAGVCMLLLIDRVLLETSFAIGAEGAGGEVTKRQPIYPLVLLVVLSIHSVIAGIALGLEAGVAASVLVMLAILFHKGSAASALMVSVHASGANRRRQWTILTVFVVMTPLGIALGTAVSSLLEGGLAVLIEGIFNALAAGTFIYVAVLNVIDPEVSRLEDRVARFVHSALIGQDDVPMPTQDSDRILKFLLVVVGLAGVAVLGI